MTVMTHRKGTMQKKIHFFIKIFILNLLTLTCVHAITFDTLPYKKSVKDSILEGNTFAESTVSSSREGKKEMQSLHFSIAGLHKKSCNYALKTLSNYEHYSKYLSFVKISQYDEKTETLNFLLSHILMPYDMQLIFRLPRVKEVGTYPYLFELGLLKNLHGNIHVIDYKNRCLFYSTADWKGPHTGINNYIFELFSQGLSKISMDVLFRISSTLNH